MRSEYAGISENCYLLVWGYWLHLCRTDKQTRQTGLSNSPFIRLCQQRNPIS